MKTYPAGQVASFALLVPPFGLGFAALLLGEPLGPLQIASALLVVSGVAYRRPPSHPHQALPGPLIQRRRSVTKKRQGCRPDNGEDRERSAPHPATTTKRSAFTPDAGRAED